MNRLSGLGAGMHLSILPGEGGPVPEQRRTISGAVEVGGEHMRCGFRQPGIQLPGSTGAFRRINAEEFSISMYLSGAVRIVSINPAHGRASGML